MNTALFKPSQQQENCPQCGFPLHIRRGKKGLFLGCSAYPNCDYLKPLQPQHQNKVLKVLDECCPECGKPLQLKQGNFGMFIGCSGYPDCDFIFHDEAENQSVQDNISTPIPCPQCERGELVARRGRQGKIFYGCNRFPQCKLTVPSKPQAQTCPYCGGVWAVLKSAAQKEDKIHRTFVCLTPSCKQSFEIIDKNEY